MKHRSLPIITLLFLTLWATPEVRGQWVQTKWSYDSGAVNCFALGGTSIYAGTSNGGVFVSRDGGMNWKGSGLSGYTVNAILVDGVKLYSATSVYGIFRSTDSGVTWMPANHGLPVDTSSAYSVFTALAEIEGVLFVGTEYRGVFRSTDGGDNWKQIISGLKDTSIRAITVADGTLIAATWTSGTYRSTDSGTTWQSAIEGLSGWDVDAFALVGQNVFAGTHADNGTDGVFRSSDYGESWELTNLNNGQLLEIYALASSGQNLFAGGWHSGVFLSQDLGESWTAFNTGLTDSSWLTTALATTGTDVLAASQVDTVRVWRRSLSDLSIATTKGSLKSSFSTYPNPFTNRTTINVTATESGVAQISIVNLLGAEVAKLFSGELGAGGHSFTWDASWMPAGMYMCIVRRNGGVDERPLILMR